jgi:golgi phosphoprotein 3
MLTLTEELFLLSLRDKKNTIGLPYSAAMPYALAGAMLVELTLAGQIQLDKDKKILPIGGPQPVQNQRLNELLVMICASGKPKKITHWINIVVGKNKKLERELLTELIDRGLLREEEKRILWVIPYTEYSQQDASVKYLRKQHLRDIVLGGQTADQRSVALLSLLKAIELLDNIFTQDEIKAALGRVKEIIKDEAIGQSVIEVLDSISSAAVMAALAATSTM